MPNATLAGARIHYEVVGRGFPLVLTTGQGTGPEARDGLIRELARHYTVLSYDQRGTGRSERVAQGQSIEALAGDVIGLMDAAGFGKAHVVGLSTGTGKATAVAANHPERVSRLVLAAPWTHGDAYLTTLQNMRKAAARTMPPDYHAHLNALLIYPPEYRREHAARFDALAQAALGTPQDAAGIAARLDAILAFDARPSYRRIACPALVVVARDDLVMPVWFAEEAAQTIPGARLVVFDGGGHLIAETRTAQFVAEVTAFLG
jgi:pimeloyl-ACP methyl ester carboxylesterase